MMNSEDGEIEQFEFDKARIERETLHASWYLALGISIAEGKQLILFQLSRKLRKHRVSLAIWHD